MDEYYRVHEEIDLDAALHNVRELKSINQGTGMVAVVKADGYGHGAVPVAKEIYGEVDGYAVATAEEALNLEAHGIDKPIYLLGYVHDDKYSEIIDKDIRPVVFDMETAERLSERAVKAGKTVKVHIAVDTGMGRIGYVCGDEAVDEIENINGLPGVELEGIFTHFATADERDKTYAYEQLENYNAFVKKVEKRGIDIPVKHCANSAAVMEMPEANFTQSRIGIALYGLYPSDEVNKKTADLKPVMSLKSHVIYVKTVPAGEAISYGRTYITHRKTRVATIPVGYADGYPRNLSNKGYVIIRGKKAPIIGRVCMDQFMVDVTDIPDVRRSDEVTLVGSDGGLNISVEELSALAGTFNYEFVCGIGKRVPRVYIKNGEAVSAKDYFHDKY